MISTIIFGIVGVAIAALLTIPITETISRWLKTGINNTYGLGLALLFWIPAAFMGCAFGFAFALSINAGILALVLPFIGGLTVQVMIVIYALLYKLITGSSR